MGQFQQIFVLYQSCRCCLSVLVLHIQPLGTRRFFSLVELVPFEILEYSSAQVREPATQFQYHIQLCIWGSTNPAFVMFCLADNSWLFHCRMSGRNGGKIDSKIKHLPSHFLLLIFLRIPSSTSRTLIDSSVQTLEWRHDHLKSSAYIWLDVLE